jgi:hypothetical protein
VSRGLSGRALDRAAGVAREPALVTGVHRVDRHDRVMRQDPEAAGRSVDRRCELAMWIARSQTRDQRTLHASLVSCNKITSASILSSASIVDGAPAIPKLTL